MAAAARGQGGPAAAKPNSRRNQVLERELAELERKKMVEIRSGQVCMTREGYIELVRRGLARRRS